MGDVEPPTAFRVSTAAACIVAPAPAPPLISIHTSLKESLVPHLLHSVRDKGRSRSRNRIASAPYSTVQYSTVPTCATSSTSIQFNQLHHARESPSRRYPFLHAPAHFLGPTVAPEASLIHRPTVPVPLLAFTDHRLTHKKRPS